MKKLYLIFICLFLSACSFNNPFLTSEELAKNTIDSFIKTWIDNQSSSQIKEKKLEKYATKSVVSSLFPSNGDEQEQNQQSVIPMHKSLESYQYIKWIKKQNQFIAAIEIKQKISIGNNKPTIQELYINLKVAKINKQYKIVQFSNTLPVENFTPIKDSVTWYWITDSTTIENSFGSLEKDGLMQGIEMKSEKNKDNMYCMTDGIVIVSSKNEIVISHGNGLYSIYDGDLKSKVQIGDEVKQTQLIGTYDKSLKFSIKYNGQYLDPYPYFKNDVIFFGLTY